MTIIRHDFFSLIGEKKTLRTKKVCLGILTIYILSELYVGVTVQIFSP
jgi:hypothetical protein